MLSRLLNPKLASNFSYTSKTSAYDSESRAWKLIFALKEPSGRKTSNIRWLKIIPFCSISFRISPSFTKQVNFSKIAKGFSKPMFLWRSLKISSLSEGTVKLSTGETKKDWLPSSKINWSTYMYWFSLKLLKELNSSGAGIILLLSLETVSYTHLTLPTTRIV